MVQQAGTIALVKGATTSTFLDITGNVESGGERGLLSMAFPLDYATSGLFYVYYTANARPARSRSRSTASTPRTPTRRTRPTHASLLTIPHDQQGNHNGGQLQFGPDGALYAGTGDGGDGGDPSGNAQDITPAPPSVGGTIGHMVNHDYRLGKLLRIDPATGAFSIFSYGLRNPWRFSYDRTTGDLIIGDVGQGAYEEVDFAAAPGNGVGSNYGWNTYEGAHTYPGDAPAGSAPGTVAAGRRVPAQRRLLDHRGLRRARSGPARARRHLPLRRQLHAAPSRAPRCRPGRRVRWASTWRTCRASARTAAGASTPLRSAVPSTASRAAARAPGRRPSSASCLPGSRARPRPGPDRRAPALTLLRAAARQHALRTGFVTIRVRCDELCTVSASGRVLITRRAHAAAAAVLRTRTARATLVAGARSTLRLKLSKATRRAIRRSLARGGRRATVRISVRAADRSGNARTATRRVRIVR